jgi:hypothetical protein
MLLAVDPGISACGCALFAGRTLVQAQLVRNTCSDTADLAERFKCMAIAVCDAHEGVSSLAIEYPVAYRKREFHKGDQNDLLKIAAVVGTILARLGVPSRLYFPYDWKRQMTKAITRRRVEKRLSMAEAAVVVLPAATLQHNVFDGIGVGLHDVGRQLF